MIRDHLAMSRIAHRSIPFVTDCLVGAVAVMCLVAGCADPPARETVRDITPEIQTGYAAVSKMRDASNRREYVTYFDQYELLRRTYIEVAEALQSGVSNDKTATVAILTEWEDSLEMARENWQAIPEMEMPHNLPAPLGKLLKQNQSNWHSRNEEWKPVEARLTNAIEFTRRFASNE